jgi:hypothetical protein
VPVTWNYSPLINLVNDALTRLKPARVAYHLMAFTCRRLRRSFRRGGCNVVATLPVNVDPKTSLSLTYSIHCQNRPKKRNPALTLSPSEGNALSAARCSDSSSANADRSTAPQIPSYIPVCLFVLDGIRLYDQAHAPLPVAVKQLHVSSCWNVIERAAVHKN